VGKTVVWERKRNSGTAEEKLRKHEAFRKSHDWTKHRKRGGRNQYLCGEKSKIINK